MRRIATALLVLVCLAGAAGWWYFRSASSSLAQPGSAKSPAAWLDSMHSYKFPVSEQATRELRQEGSTALPAIQETLRNPTAKPERKKAALKACGVLGTDAAAAVPDVATHLTIPAFTLAAATALGFMGPDAFVPLRDALASEDPIVRRESLRAIGKLHGRARVESAKVIPLLLDGLADPDPDVRLVSAIYLGIIHEEGPEVVPALMEMLQDEDPEVRTSAAEALASFGADADIAVPALRKAQGDPDENVAREAGVTLVKLNKL